MQRSRTRRSVAAMVLGAALVAIAQGTTSATTVPGTEPPGTEPAGTEPAGTEPAGTEPAEDRRWPAAKSSQCGFAPSDTTDGDLSGFAGTTPLTDRPDFRDAVCGVDPAAPGLQLRRRGVRRRGHHRTWPSRRPGPTGSNIASEINGITREGTKCTSFAECRDLIAAGEDIDYDGISGPLEFDGNGEPTEASYGLLQHGRQQPHRSDPHRVHHGLRRTARTPRTFPVEGTREGDGVLTIGELLPQTGSLAYLGPPEFAGVQLAVDEINAAGGVLGQDVVVPRG